ncbi:NADPH-dependent F420 reductase [Lysinibacter sp. HNR]|uniref:NADPH-dependent F420 reductase n=1 Tax=Lysinibacter sp. HNR TaxID=3031408 RepID=UPI002435B699|nr:NADPH-dependent F420 reductase [Lysinibacter sp. HNR]WGD36364.1 NADPH-dependent F420 reductase [Lysinibacter sp. HNR]
MTAISIIGGGNMAQAIGGVLSAGGGTVEYLGRAGGDVTGEIVVLAVPYASIDQVIATYGEALRGKIVIDITNPINFETFDGFLVPADSSAAVTIAGKLPESRVVKAFNTTFAATLAAKTVGGQKTTVLLAGDDADAKNTVETLISTAGLAVADIGALKRARELEAFAFLQISLASAERITWNGGFALLS